jgi:hypothetical protein
MGILFSICFGVQEDAPALQEKKEPLLTSPYLQAVVSAHSNVEDVPLIKPKLENLKGSVD